MAVTGAIGSVTREDIGSGVTKVTIPWTSDASAGSVGEIAVELPAGTLLRLRTDPGSAAPTDNYDITLLDAIGGADVLGGVGANRDTTNTEIAVPVEGTYFRPWIAGGDYYPTIAAAGNEKTGTIELFIARGMVPV